MNVRNSKDYYSKELCKVHNIGAGGVNEDMSADFGAYDTINSKKRFLQYCLRSMQKNNWNRRHTVNLLNNLK